MTEDDAKTKTCCGPQLLTIILALGKTDGRVELTDNPGRCIGSDCMAWRAVDPDTQRQVVPFGPAAREEDVAVPEGNGWKLLGSTLGSGAAPERNSAVFERVTALRGYCGLAGAPR